LNTTFSINVVYGLEIELDLAPGAARQQEAAKCSRVVISMKIMICSLIVVAAAVTL
jgi:hypothetical protein